MSANEINAKAYFEQATRGRGGLNGKPAGWVIYNVETGKRIGLDIRYATEQAANDAIERTVAAQQKKATADREQADVESARQDRAHRTVRNSAFGTGRVYADQPGATQYDDGSGRYNVQIWDNA